MRAQGLANWSSMDPGSIRLSMTFFKHCCIVRSCIVCVLAMYCHAELQKDFLVLSAWVCVQSGLFIKVEKKIQLTCHPLWTKVVSRLNIRRWTEEASELPQLNLRVSQKNAFRDPVDGSWWPYCACGGALTVIQS